MPTPRRPAPTWSRCSRTCLGRGSPVRGGPSPTGRRLSRRSAGRSALLFAVLAFAVLWFALVRFPPFFLIPLVWIFLARGHRGRRGGPWGAPSHRW